MKSVVLSAMLLFAVPQIGLAGKNCCRSKVYYSWQPSYRVYYPRTYRYSNQYPRATSKVATPAAKIQVHRPQPVIRYKCENGQCFRR